MKKVVIGLSGGVDSSVAAYLLKQQGYDVTALFMVNWHDRTGSLTGSCTWEDDALIAEMVAKKLDMPFHIVDLSKDYKKRVVDYMFDEYRKGRTPNPDVLCNREIKFDIFLDECLKYGADYVATGHYCRKEEFTKDGQTIYRLLAGTDNNKDQSYFLCQLNQQQLAKALFPIGHLEKPEVRRIAAELQLPTADRKDSQGICFVGKVDLPTFLQQQLEPKTGNVIEVQAEFMARKKQVEHTTDNFKKLCFAYPYKPWNGIVIGEHRGAHFYTVGQRKGLNIGGHQEPLFILGTDVTRNIIYVGEGTEHPGLFRPGLFIPAEETHWIRTDLQMQPGDERCYEVRIRYRQPLEKATLYQREEGIYMLFDNEQRGVTSGQFAAWYDGDELIGSGVIAG
ncbi:MAG: tRNA 2-thiouridine(34) synthase MnmA [Bacteroidetes bacterium GWF2_42_66]|nr:MAG: tRNA 2-thiouridine(34) synthase MnmA [Bacteroidetes bacterium GWA2_42_15]OFX98069.1 MAG: tRNA 2-thiouridine(34) synthase MnmA [Bacteroidetes bacterium GWE2_42_39]OFY42452.1 MAG: tRNA 2-thiouridine(34) synthase MnmA [Bacteroidetes bacterium GWF2_42_66]HBL74162.1 tRNA 2-thiouridine(34) synthase MnmA [Prolixibacteraceae bacterium]HCU63931.1 tRNA 2-thiouridine(34) synthase MnmA [Prolixibacteraceae bacterium]